MTASNTELKYIEDFLIELAEGNFSSSLFINSNEDEHIQSVKTGINMLVEELRETTTSKTFLNSIYNGINDILIVIDDKGSIQKTNQIVERILGYKENELLNKPVQTLIHLSDVDQIKQCIRDAYQLSEIQEAGLNFITKDNIIIPVSCSFSVLQNNKNKRSGVLLVAKNISTLLDTKNQLQAKNDELNLFVYKASHDLKSPVTSMMGLMSLINKSNDLTEIKSYCQMVEKCTDKLNVILNELLILGHITYGELEISKVNVHEFIDDVLTSIQFLENFSFVTITINISNEINYISTEKGLFQTILFNLIDNSIKYCNKQIANPFLKINISNYYKGILIQVEDNGIGIEKEFQSNIFKMFYRANYISKGSGLGLYIVKTSVAKLEGHISFESIAGEGSIFRVYIPCEVN